MRHLKTPEEIIKDGGYIYDNQTKGLIIDLIKAAQRDALECVGIYIKEHIDDNGFISADVIKTQLERNLMPK